MAKFEYQGRTDRLEALLQTILDERQTGMLNVERRRGGIWEKAMVIVLSGQVFEANAGGHSGTEVLRWLKTWGTCQYIFVPKMASEMVALLPAPSAVLAQPQPTSPMPPAQPQPTSPMPPAQMQPTSPMPAVQPQPTSPKPPAQTQPTSPIAPVRTPPVIATSRNAAPPLLSPAQSVSDTASEAEKPARTNDTRRLYYKTPQPPSPIQQTPSQRSVQPTGSIYPAPQVQQTLPQFPQEAYQSAPPTPPYQPMSITQSMRMVPAPPVLIASRLTQGPEALVFMERVGLTRLHRHVFLLVDGQRSAADIVRLTKHPLEEIQRLLDELERYGLIRQD